MRCVQRQSNIWLLIDTEGLRMHMNTTMVPIDCPYCGEVFDLVVDPSETVQNYVEDCYVCCSPINLTVTVATDGGIAVTARDENDC